MKVAHKAALIGFALMLTPVVATADPFRFVSLPDTQVYTENRFPNDGRNPPVTDPRGTAAIFFDQTQWIVDNWDAQGLKYVGHLGDIVQNGSNLTEWATAKSAMNILLDADRPHGTVMGNHDDTHPPEYAVNYLNNFGPDVFAGRPWYAASSPNGGGNFQLLEHEGRKIGFLNFSIDHPQVEIDWANQIVKENRDAHIVVGTHRYLYDFKIAGGRYGEPINTPLGELTLQDNFVDGVVDPNTGQELFEKFVSQHSNIVMIHAGHFHSEWIRQDDTNPNGQTIIQILTDYQSTRNGGDGWLRLYEFDFDANTLSFDTYSPTLDRYRTTIDHFVETIYLAWDQRGQIMDALNISEFEYLIVLELLLKNTPAPDGFLLQHPDFDEQEERDYYNQYLSDLFMGEPLPGFDDILEWEGLWLTAFAADPSDPFNFDDWVRSPSGTMPVDFDAFLVPAPTSAVLALLGFAALGFSARRVTRPLQHPACSWGSDRFRAPGIRFTGLGCACVRANLRPCSRPRTQVPGVPHPVARALVSRRNQKCCALSRAAGRPRD